MIIASCDSLIVILVTFIIKLENGVKKHVRNVVGIKHGFFELVAILFTLSTRCDYMIPSNYCKIYNTSPINSKERHIGYNLQEYAINFCKNATIKFR